MSPIVHGIMDKKMAAPIDLSGTSTSRDTISDMQLDNNLMEFQTMKAVSDPAKVSPIFLVHQLLSIDYLMKFLSLINLLELQSAAEPFGFIEIAWIFGRRITSERCRDCCIKSKLFQQMFQLLCNCFDFVQ